jgi:3-deoxy-D-manno-octulosonate 8-phosphate phosphatase (KDO 8-P phosphatase)
VAVGDAPDSAKAVAHYVTHIEGGRGAVREVIDLILEAKAD